MTAKDTLVQVKAVKEENYKLKFGRGKRKPETDTHSALKLPKTVSVFLITGSLSK